MSKILVIDDEETNVRVLSITLRADGYDVVTACSGEEGLEVFEREAPDVVLTDIKMPGMDGIEVLKRIKADDPDAEVVIITGHGDIDNTIEALQFGASDFISKPIREEALAIALKRAHEKLDIKRQLREYTHNLESKVKLATLELRRKSNFLSKLIRSSNDGVVATDDAFQVVIFNPGAERIFAHNKADVIAKVNALELYPPEIADFFTREKAVQADQGELPWRETVITAKDGSLIPVRFSGTLLHEKMKVVGSVAFFQDLREIKTLEKELVQSERLAAIGQTVAGLAHGIKNVLHGFKGGRYLVNIGIDRDDPEKLTTGWNMIQRNIDRISDLALDLLSYSKQREPEYERCRPNEIAGDVCDLLDETAREHQVKIVAELDPHIEEVLMDPRTIHRSLLNIVSNAIDACIFDGNIDKTWQVHVKTSLEGKNTIRFDVIDNGAGMSEKVKNKIFASFFSTKGHRGTGLGLLVTRKHVEEHGGSIGVASEEGKGTTFTIRLPYKPVETSD